SATIRVTLSEPNYAGAVFVDYQSNGGSASSGGDYGAVNSTLMIPVGETEASFTIPIMEDALDEADETIRLVMSNPQGAILGAIKQMVLSIVDNDAPPTLSVSGGTALETASVVQFHFVLSAASGQPITLTINTVNGTASAPTDFVALVNHKVVIPIGAKNTTVEVTLVDDNLNEETEEFFLSVSAENATLTAGQASAKITDNDEFRLFMPVIRRSR
ncbi:MAG TPA: Calx-beta domain-containing protein, partial [Caldilineaceae bacterium]|nr:Calx-beta domain-containing protein [Caldilineaceae bacterium]